MPLPVVPSPNTPEPRKLSWTAVALLCGAAASAYGMYTGRLVVPERFNPWAPLDVMALPNFLTDYKLSRARASPAACLSALARTGMAYDLLPDRITGPGCGFDNAVRLRTAGVRIGAPLPLSCPMALSFFMWERHALQPAAERHFGRRVAAIEHLGSYACRNINRGEAAYTDALTGPRSRHATADALDIAGFTLEGGQRITVLEDWKNSGAATPKKSQPMQILQAMQAQMLADAHAGACRFFPGVLGPDYNAAHRDHFHLETGGYRMCR